MLTTIVIDGILRSVLFSKVHMARWLSRLERRPVTAEVVGSIPSRVAFVSALKIQENNVYGWVPERPKGADCKSVVTDFGGSNPPPSIDSKESQWGLSSAGRASALQAGGHRFEPYRPH